ncbi:MAG TPA: nuclear transport factor 2 family protein, partial [Pyrinomonadaceae bacterium]
MSRSTVLIATLIAASLMIVSCEQPPAANSSSANKPANATANTGTASTTATNHEAEVKKIMSDMAAALAKNDAEAASKFYADDYHLVTPQGVDQNKSARMADMRSGSTKFDSFSYENIAVRSYGDAAVAIADVKATGTAAGQPVASNIKA